MFSVKYFTLLLNVHLFTVSNVYMYISFLLLFCQDWKKSSNALWWIFMDISIYKLLKLCLSTLSYTFFFYTIMNFCSAHSLRRISDCKVKEFIWFHPNDSRGLFFVQLIFVILRVSHLCKSHRITLVKWIVN